MKNSARYSLVVILLFGLTSFRGDETLVFPDEFPSFPDFEFMVFSDPHYYSQSLGTTGKAFEDYLDRDRKLLKESEEILESALAKCMDFHGDFVLVPGDLTKDGCLESHLGIAQKLREIEASGKKVYVVPGNHDISNPESFAYRDSITVKTDNVSPEEFLSIYHDFGYGEAVYRDPSSLSFVAEPVQGLWLLGIDACRYEENGELGHPVTGGRIRKSTLEWVNDRLEEAGDSGKSVIGFMHHGILEHYKRQKKFFSDYVIDDYRKISALFATGGMKLVFTGHYHAQDISGFTGKDGNFLFDIQTGSLVTYPCPLRMVTIQNNVADIRTQTIDRIESHPDKFPEFSRQFVWSGIEGIARETLIGFKLEESEAALLSGQVANAFLAHYKGDESPVADPLDLTGVSLKGRFYIGFKKRLITSLWNDLPPADNNLRIDLRTGTPVLVEESD